MKYLISISILFFAGMLAIANTNNKTQKIKTENIRAVNLINNGLSEPFMRSEISKNLPVYKAKNLKSPVGEVIGITTYDLQTNSGMSRRVVTNPPGTFTYVGWTMGREFIPGDPNRGTGYNFYNRNTGKWSNNPTSRIEENNRTGWPSIGYSQGRQFAITHTGSQGMLFTYRAGNQSTWNEVQVGEIVGDTDGVWAKSATDTPNIYAIIGRLNASFNGIDGGLHIIRSTDNGTNWESMGGLEEDYSDTYALNIFGDTYSIDAANDIVSVVVGTTLTPVVLYRSDDKAETWSKTIVQPMPGNQLVLDLNNNSDNPDFTVDPYFASDGGNTIIIDSEGKSHIVFSSSVVFNPADNDFVGTGATLRMRETGALHYWNEDMTAPEILGKSIMYDSNGDGILGSALTNIITQGTMPFYSNIIAHPQLAINGNNDMYLSYTSLVDGAYVPSEVIFESSDDSGETTREFSQYFDEETTLYSDVFMLKSTDGGATWQGPLNVTNAPNSEEAYGSIARFITDTIFLAYQHDAMPGTLLRGPQNFATINEIAVTKILPDDINNEAAPADSEPYLTAFYTYITIPQNCNVTNEQIFKNFAWGLDYPEGLLTEIKSKGLVDYSQTGIFVEEVYVEDSAGNQSDPVEVTVEIIADEQPPVIELDGGCTKFAILQNTEWKNPEVKITDMIEVNGILEPSICDVSENLLVENNIITTETGLYTVLYTVSDFAGNESTLTLSVEVIEADTAGPEISISGLPELLYLFQPFNPADVLITATDNIDCNNVSIEIVGLQEVNSEIIGDYEIIITATDQSGNTTIETRLVKVGDHTAPTIELFEPYTITINFPGLCGDDLIFGREDDPWVYAYDETDGNLSDEVIAVYNNGEEIDCTIEGTYTITYTVADAAGNVGSAERLIIIDPSCAPPDAGVIECGE